MFNESDYENEISEWRLTVEELKSCHGFEGITEEQADEVIDSLVRLAIIAYNV